MSELKPKIIASTPEEFKEISDKLATLPEYIRDQIEIAEMGILSKFLCKVRYDFKTQPTIYLPKTTQIKDFGDYIYCYCDEFIFMLGKEIKKNPLEYIFIDIFNVEKNS
jgi:hypothetical protein